MLFVMVIVRMTVKMLNKVVNTIVLVKGGGRVMSSVKRLSINRLANQLFEHEIHN